MDAFEQGRWIRNDTDDHASFPEPIMHASQYLEHDDAGREQGRGHYH